MKINDQFINVYPTAANDSLLIGYLKPQILLCKDDLLQRSANSGLCKPSITNLKFFKIFSDKALHIERHKYLQGDITKQTYGMFLSRINANLNPFFANYEVSSITSKDLSLFINYLQKKDIKAITIKQYLGLLKRILLISLEEGVIQKIPIFPNLKTKSIPRGSFSLNEYSAILKATKAMELDLGHFGKKNHRYIAQGAFTHKKTVPLDMKWLIRFMVNSFIRPVDIKLIQHKHIEIITGGSTYLRLNIPETKRHSGQVVTMRAAKDIYERLKEYQTTRGFGKPNDYLFLPEVKDRNSAIQLITAHFKKILEHADLRKNQNGQNRTLYSLRHTAITFRLLYGDGIDLLTLARNARTSVEMIEKFYSSNLTPEMNIKVLQSKRTQVDSTRG